MADQNKTPQNLSPDLKQIYDRVMNTPAAKPAPTAPAAMTPPAIPTTPPATASPDISRPTPPAPPKPEVANPSVIPQSPMANVAPPTSNDFLSSTPPRPLQGSVGVQSFSLGKDKKEETKIDDVKPEKKGISRSLIIILGVVFFAAWTFFWVIFFFQPFS